MSKARKASARARVRVRARAGARVRVTLSHARKELARVRVGIRARGRVSSTKTYGDGTERRSDLRSRPSESWPPALVRCGPMSARLQEPGHRRRGGAPAAPTAPASRRMDHTRQEPHPTPLAGTAR